MPVRALLIIFGFLALGEGVVYLTGVHFPSSLIGMLFLTVALHFKWVKVEWIKEISDLLISNLGLLFVPPSVGVMQYFGIIGKSFTAFLAAVLVSTVVVIFISGKVYEFFRNRAK